MSLIIFHLHLKQSGHCIVLGIFAGVKCAVFVLVFAVECYISVVLLNHINNNKLLSLS